jgi:DNA-directed RNA polymerase subunit RPC12/RpoP
MFRRMFIGRNGPDQLSLGLTLLAFVLSLIRVNVLFYISLAILALAILRMFSRNIEQRRKENLMFLKLVNKPKMWYYNFKASVQQNKAYRIFKCSQCGQKLRVPRGKGKVSIKCSKCGNRMIKNT